MREDAAVSEEGDTDVECAVAAAKGSAMSTVAGAEGSAMSVIVVDEGSAVAEETATSVVAVVELSEMSAARWPRSPTTGIAPYADGQGRRHSHD